MVVAEVPPACTSLTVARIDALVSTVDRVAAWIAGRVAADGKPADVLANPEIRKNVIGE